MVKRDVNDPREPSRKVDEGRGEKIRHYCSWVHVHDQRKYYVFLLLSRVDETVENGAVVPLDVPFIARYALHDSQNGVANQSLLDKGSKD